MEMPDVDLIASDHLLSTAEQQNLRCLAGLMIPMSEEHRVPGADDATIFTDILATLRPSASLVIDALRLLSRLGGSDFAALPPDRQHAAAERFRTSGSPLVSVIVALVAQCYYRDDRVMSSLGMEPRPPFPLGFVLEDGDWSLLDPVRARPRLYREVR
jgi:hypothetical protein